MGMVYFFTGLEVLVIITIFVAMRLLLTGEGSREQKMMVYCLCGSLVQNVGYLFELTADSLDAVVTAIKIENMGSLFIPLLYCWFIYGYCYEKPPRLLLKLFAVIDFAMLPMILFDQRGLFYKDMQWMMTDYGFHYVQIEYGPLYQPFLIIRIIIPYALSIYGLTRAVRSRSDDAVKRQYKTMLAISMLPVLALFAYVGKLIKVFDITPMVLGFSLSLVEILIWSRRNYDFRHLAADEVLNSMGDGVIALDEQRRLISYNRAALTVFQGLRDCRLGERVDHLQYFREEMLDERKPLEFEVRGRLYESHTKQIRDDSGKKQGYVILVIDVTDTRNYINEIKNVRKQAEQANAAKSEFLANMSHEIRTPMNAIIGLSDLIMEESAGSSINDHVRDVRSAAQNLLALINDILDLSKVEAGKMELVPSEYYIKGVVGEVVGMMDMAASQRGILMKYEYDETIPCRYYGDEGRIKQILINLLTNAVKFTKEGYVRISTAGRPGAAPDEELLVFEIEDTGCGIRKEDQNAIFEDFKQVDSKRNRTTEGTGLGLSIVRHLVQLMNGSVELHSVYGEGTTFTVTIPQKIVDARTLKEVPEVPRRELEETDSFVAPEIKVLIVDDNLVNRKVARGFLNTYEFDLTEASSGPEAIEWVKKTRFDIIFMDHMMPEMDGLETVEIIRRDCGENGNYPIIVALTANAMEGVQEKFLNSGFQDFIAKPLRRKPLQELLLRWIPEDVRSAKDAAGWEQASAFADIVIEGIDMDAVRQHHSGGTADYLELLELFCTDGDRKVALLRELLEEKDIKHYQIEVHGLKSAAANIGAMKLSALAKGHEEACDRGDEQFIVQEFSELIVTYEKQLADIRVFLNQQRERTDEHEGGEELLPEMEYTKLVSELREALEFLEDFQAKECASRINALLAYRHPQDIAHKLREIQKLLKLYEDDEAENQLHHLLDLLEKTRK